MEDITNHEKSDLLLMNKNIQLENNLYFYINNIYYYLHNYDYSSCF